MIFVIDSGIAGDIGGLACLKARNVDIWLAFKGGLYSRVGYNGVSTVYVLTCKPCLLLRLQVLNVQTVVLQTLVPKNIMHN